MQQTYVRFVTFIIDRDSGKRRGIFQAVADLKDAKELADYESVELEDLRSWFNEHLKAPDRFARSPRKNAAPKAISWFKSCAVGYLDRMHAMCRILNEHNIKTDMIISDRPGYIVFEDEHQIAAVPFAETTT